MINVDIFVLFGLFNLLSAQLTLLDSHTDHCNLLEIQQKSRNNFHQSNSKFVNLGFVDIDVSNNK